MSEKRRTGVATFASTELGCSTLDVQDEVLDLERKLVGVAIGTVGESLNAAFLITIDDLIAGLARDAELSAKISHRLTS